MDDERGKIHHRKRAKQLIDFSNMRYGNITPTDCDGFIEYHNLAYVFFETKYEDAEMPFGQRLALERLQDDLEKVKPVITIVSTHSVDNPDDDIDAASTTVTQYRFHRKWYFSDSITTTKDLVNRFLKWVEHGFQSTI